MSSDLSGKAPRRAIHIGKYEVLSHIATGGMGAVYKARDVELRRDVALKVLSPEMAARPGLLERFRREAVHSARLRHENIVALYECGEFGGTHFLALEFVDGIDLEEYIERKGKLDPEEARAITLQAALALDHAHAQGIVHRDVKPSNFLITHPNGDLLVKMTDFGLARETGDEDFRVTRAGTTVGTIDYIAPEQARDSALADIRSDLYSLGCSLFHMLSGQAPFSEGGLTERLYKHIEAEPPDILDFNPNVPPSLRAVLYRLLAKKPEDRYQTPADLVHDLLHPDKIKPKQPPVTRRDVLAGLADIESPNRTGKVRTRSAGRVKVPRPVPVNRRLHASETRDRLAATTLSEVPPDRVKPWLLGVGAALLLLLLVVALVITWRALKSNPAVATETSAPVAAETPSFSGPDADPRPKKNPDGQAHLNAAGKPKALRWPALYEPAVPLDLEKLKSEFESWAAGPQVPVDAPVFRISRVPRSGVGPHFDSLAVACAAAPADRVTILEIHDNGPLFAAAVTVKNRSLLIRPGRGFHPLLIWDCTAGERESPPGSNADAFLGVTQGNLTLENLELAVRREGSSEPGAFVRILGGDLEARGCTFSVAGKQGGSVAIAWLDGPPESAPPRCRLSACFGRGGQLEVANIHGPGAQVLIENCLFVGGVQPLLRVRGYQQSVATTIRVSHSTLIARQTLMQVRPAGDGDVKPAVHWFGLDTVLARSADQSGGTLVDFDSKTETGGLQWHATNCCYAGWKNLLACRDTIPATDLISWRRLAGYAEGDLATTDAWPAVISHDPEETLPETYRSAPYPETPVGYASTFRSGPLGCDPALLPPAHRNWVSLTHELFALPSLDMLRGVVPSIATFADDRYHGERLDLNRIDLGAYLKEIQESRKLGPTVVLHLRGSGERKCSPIHWTGAALTLYVEPAAEGVAPLSLVPLDSDPAGNAAWLDVEDGNLDLIGLEARCPDFKLALLPPYLVRVRGGNLRVHGCRLYGPREQPPDAYRGLVRLEGANQPTPDRTVICTVNESVLVSGKNGLHVRGTGVHLALRQSVVVAGADALSFEPKTAEAKMNLSCELDHTTVASQGAVLRLGTVTGTDLPLEPLVVQAQASAFLAPFAEQRSGLLVCEGESLARGLLVWQGVSNVYDKRLHSFITLDDESPERAQPFTAWTRLWGPMNERHAFVNVPLTSAWKWEPLQWDRLVLPEIKPTSDNGPMKSRPGADLGALGLFPKPGKPMK